MALFAWTMGCVNSYWTSFEIINILWQIPLAQQFNIPPLHSKLPILFIYYHTQRQVKNKIQASNSKPLKTIQIRWLDYLTMENLISNPFHEFIKLTDKYDEFSDWACHVIRIDPNK